MAFSMKMSRAWSGMLTSENDDLKFLKLQKHKMHVHHVQHSSRTRFTVLSLQTSLSLTRNVTATDAKELYCIFFEVSKFQFW